LIGCCGLAGWRAGWLAVPCLGLGGMVWWGTFRPAVNYAVEGSKLWTLLPPPHAVYLPDGIGPSLKGASDRHAWWLPYDCVLLLTRKGTPQTDDQSSNRQPLPIRYTHHECGVQLY
jgi:hypothetical protein